MSRKTSLKKIALSSLFVALGAGLGYLLAPIPNIELVTLTIFFAGYSLGYFRGALVGLLIWLLYGVFNPFGMAPLPILFAQVLSGVIIGTCGAFVFSLRVKVKNRILKIVIYTLSGALSTLIFQILLNLSAFFVFASQDTIVGFILGGIAFAFMHVLFNCMVFTIVLPPLDAVLSIYAPIRDP